MRYILKEFFFKVVCPVVAALFLFAMFKNVFTNNGVTDYKLVMLVCGIPFGMRYMYVWLIPRRLDIGGTVGTFAFTFLIGGLVGSVVMVWKLLCAVYYFFKCIVQAVMLATGRLEMEA